MSKVIIFKISSIQPKSANEFIRNMMTFRDRFLLRFSQFKPILTEGNVHLVITQRKKFLFPHQHLMTLRIDSFVLFTYRLILYTIQPAFLVKRCSNLEHLHRNTWKILTRKAASFVRYLPVSCFLLST